MALQIRIGFILLLVAVVAVVWYLKKKSSVAGM